MSHKINFVEIKTMEELRNLNLKAIIFKLYSPSCPPCHQLAEYLKTKETEKQITVVDLNVATPNEISKAIISMFNLKGVPFLLYATPKLQTIKALPGYNPQQVDVLLEEFNPEYEHKEQF